MHAGHSWGKGDPIMTGFGGRAFEFLGQPGKIYSLLSEKYHQVGPFLAHTLQIHHKALPAKPDRKVIILQGQRLVALDCLSGRPCLHSSPRASLALT